MSNSEWVKLLTENITIKVVKNFVKIGIASHFLLLIIGGFIIYLLLNEQTFRNQEAFEHGVFTAKLWNDSSDIHSINKRLDWIDSKQINLTTNENNNEKNISEIKGRLRMFNE